MDTLFVSTNSATFWLAGVVVLLAAVTAVLNLARHKRARCLVNATALGSVKVSQSKSRPDSPTNSDTWSDDDESVSGATRASDSTLTAAAAVPLGKPPGPYPWPILGSLHLLARYEVPFEGFTEMSKVYGDLFAITLGTTPCVIANSFPLIKEVLITKGPHFGGRPNFIRYHKLFGGDRDNSLALCDWSDLQKARRSIARNYCHPRPTSMQFETLSHVLSAESAEMVQELHKLAGKPADLKPTLLAMCANVFSHYMCSARFDYQEPEFQKMVRQFDLIFWDINQGYAVDFLPWLLPAYKRHMETLTMWGQNIREFILQRIIEQHRTTFDKAHIRDFTDALLAQLEDTADTDGHNALNWEHILFELEDFLGGHSAIGNLLMRAVGELCRNPEALHKAQEEIQRVTGGVRPVVLEDRPHMLYTEAVILETLRLSSSPIVPHVAMQDTSIAGYSVPEGTMVFLNNYELNMSPAYWDKPLQFEPSRFIKGGKIHKPDYFIPFSTGKRACMGYRLVQHVTFVALATLLQNFNMTSLDPSSIHLPKACVAVAPDAFPVLLTVAPTAN